MLLHAYNSNIWEAEAGESTAWAMQTITELNNKNLTKWVFCVNYADVHTAQQQNKQQQFQNKWV